MAVISGRVLVVDGDYTWQQQVARWLRAEGFDVETAASRTEALKWFSNHTACFQVIVTATELRNEVDPNNQDGYLLADEIRKRDECIKIIILANSATVSEAVEAVSVPGRGYFFFIEKYPLSGIPFSKPGPFDAPTFIRKVKDGAKESKDQRGKVEKEQRSSRSQKLDIFVVMPFAKKYDATYTLIQTVASELELTCKRSDDMPAPGPIMEQVEKSIEQSRMVIADLSNKNLNVYFEAGISDAKRKPTIFLARKESDVAKLIEGKRVINYQDSLAGGDKLKVELKKQIEYVLNGVDSQTYPPYDRKETTQKTCLVITANNNAGEETFKSIIQPEVSEEFEYKYVWDFYKTPNSNIPKTIMNYLESVDQIITDLSGSEADVYYLSGYAFGINKNPIALFDKRSKILFDMKTIGKILYSKESEDDIKNARIELAELINSLLHGDNNMIKPSSSKVKVFLNHAIEDKPLVRKLNAKLKKYSWIDPWIDEDQLLPGQNFGLEIDKAMEEADAVLVCISKTSVKKKGYVQAEIRKAEEQQNLRPLGEIYMIPVLLEPCKNDVPHNLQKLHWVDISDPKKIKDIIKSLKTLKK